MVTLLKDLKENHHVTGVKAEFEAEGTRLEEALRLKEVLMKAGLGLTLKIGGCEAIRDMYEARVIGVARIVAPMIETPYALEKFLGAIDLAIPPDEKDDIAIAINIETESACANLDAMLKVADIKKLSGIVIGRTDLSRSLGMTAQDVNSDKTCSFAKTVIDKAKNLNLVIGIGGGVSAEALPFFRGLKEGHLDYYETRKVMFGCPGALGADAGTGILKALQFELYWLENKRDFYRLISAEDEQRIKTLESRYRKSIEALGINK